MPPWLELALAFSKDTLASVRITGDFFGTKPVEELEDLLVGSTSDAPLTTDPSPYIAGMTKEMLEELLWQ